MTPGRLVVRSACRFVLLLGLAIPTTWARELTFADRVQAQEAIERVYYAHQVGATRPFDEAVPRVLLEEKVRKYLRQSVALEELWKYPVTAEVLERETERMARKTRMPERLRELFAALGDDSVLVQECLVRPALVDRLTRGFFAFDERIHADARHRSEALRDAIAAGAIDPAADHPMRTISASPAETDEQKRERAACAGVNESRTEPIATVADESERFVVRVALRDRSDHAIASYSVPKASWDEWWGRTRESFDERRFRAAAKEATALPAIAGLSKGSAGSCAEAWDDVAEDEVPDPRAGHTAVWTGSRMIVWGGVGSGDYTVGGLYDPATDTWSLTSSVGAPAPRTGHTAVWTGTRMIVWGGNSTDTGGQYDPVTDLWTAMSTQGAPPGRTYHTGVWTGSRMLVWGGVDAAFNNYPQVGGVYDPAADSWSPMSTTNAPYGRQSPAAVWTGSRMVVWGGEIPGPCHQPPELFASGGQYDPASNTWTPTSMNGAPSARTGHTAVWTGSQVLIWGGNDLNTGGRYNPQTDTWEPMTTVNAPTARPSHTAVWTGSHMAVWGSTTDKSGGLYDPSTDTWTATTTENAPSTYLAQAAVWTGSRMVVWGGVTTSGRTLDSGGQYDPAIDQWTPTAIGDVPSPRKYHTGVWTGSKMIVWGGDNAGAGLRTGGLYDPALDTWTQTSTAGAPVTRSAHTAVWTGSKMIVWGGRDSLTYLNDGGQYDPVSDAWAPMSIIGAPSVRDAQTAVWTGSKMIVWGGRAPWPVNYLNTGGQYDPASDTWTPTSMTNVPTIRYSHATVWTGSRMIVWGGWGGSLLNTGGRYDPATDTWAPTSTVGAPSPRDQHSGIWTGHAMVLWGGSSGSSTNTGARYDPTTDTWTPTSTTAAPSARARHTAVWNGSRMVVWGGAGSLSSGGQYDPVLDTWADTTTANVPQGREAHTAIWTGNDMIVWGGSSATILNSGGLWTQAGDADGDALCDGVDNCPTVSNPSQQNADGDAQGDACDCAPIDATNPVPGEALGLRAEDGQTLVWDSVANATAYDVVRGDLAALPVGPGDGDEVCFDGLASPMLLDSAIPMGGFFYVARGKSACGSGPWGDSRTSTGLALAGAPRLTGTCP